jgi:hypothetical protein
MWSALMNKIKITSIRETHGGELLFKNTTTRSVGAACSNLLEFELGFGGTVGFLSMTRVTTRTRIFDKIDTTIFEGSEEDMRPLLKCLLYFFKLNSKHKKYDETVMQRINEIVDEQFTTFAHDYLANVSGVIGAKLLIMNPQTDDLHFALSKLEKNDFNAIFELCAEGVELHEALKAL